MATKTKKLYSIDSKIADEFMKICKRNDQEFSGVVEEFMKLYIRKDGEVLFDDLYAPRIDQVVSRRIDKGLDRIAAMINNVNVDVTAALLMFPSVYKKTMVSIEDTLNEFVIQEVLKPTRQPLAQDFMVGQDGQVMIQTARNAARKNLNEKRIKAMQEKQESEKAASNS